MSDEKPVFYATDGAVFAPAPNNTELAVLLIRRSLDSDAFPGAWALPGGYVGDETSRIACVRELEEETGLTLDPNQLQQLRVFDAVYRDPRERVVSAPYAVWLPAIRPVKGADDAIEAKWVGVVSELHDYPLAFDHEEIIKEALRQLGFEQLIVIAAEHRLQQSRKD